MARAVAACEIPVISGIGHESDVTIVDLVADVRASTPTAAAEQAVPERAAFLSTLSEYERQMKRALQYFVNFKRQVVDDYEHRLEQALQQSLRKQRHTLDLLEAQLTANDITHLLRQGYSLTLHKGEIVNSAAKLEAGEEIETIFSDGRLRSVIQQKSALQLPPKSS